MWQVESSVGRNEIILAGDPQGTGLRTTGPLKDKYYHFRIKN